jgi:DNA-binding NtrC family response regulator
MSKSGKILVVEDDEQLRQATQHVLTHAGYDVEAAPNAVEALEILRVAPQDLALCDLNLPGMSGVDFLRHVQTEYPETNVVMMTAFGTAQTAVEAMKAGAYDYVTEPVHPQELLIVVRRALERRNMIEEIHSLRAVVDKKYGFENVIGHCPAFLRVVEAASRVALTDATVLIQGETGVGKEVLARAIHFNSPRRGRPFQVIHCGSIPMDLLESELFGHIKGSFPGALTHKTGKLEAANRGTIFLNEIGEMPLELQVRILRLIQEHEIEKVGSTTAMRVDVRIIAATHRNLPEMIARGAFREDLYYRLAVVPLTIPPLRERREDIAEFVVAFFRMYAEKYSRPHLKLSQDLLPLFTAFDWPGNVRQLQIVIERMVVLCPGDEITLSDLPDFLHPRVSHRRAEAEQFDLPEGLTLDEFERELVKRALQKENWNQSRAARELGITRKTLLGRIAKYGLERSI